MSWGTTEFFGESSYDSVFTTPVRSLRSDLRGRVGRLGCLGGPMYLSVSPNVLSVGGTTLSVSGNSYVSESGWSGSTGGFSGLDSYWRSTRPSLHTRRRRSRPSD